MWLPLRRVVKSSASVDDIEPDQVTPRGLGGSMPVIRPVVQGEAPSWATNPSEPLPDDVMERAREQLRADFESRRDERRDEVRDEIDAFLDDEGIDSATAGKVHDLLDQFGAKMDGMREQMRSGEVDRGELRMKFREEREALDAALNDALGTETADRLRDRMPGPGPRGGPMRPGGGGGRGGGL